MTPSTRSSFLGYEMSEEEIKQAYSYSELQRAGIQNLIADAAEELLTAPLSENDTDIVAIKRRALLQGQIGILKYLLELHETTKDQTQGDPQ